MPGDRQRPRALHGAPGCPPEGEPGGRRSDTSSTHYLIELWEADRATLDSVDRTRAALREAADRAGATVLHAAFHHFDPVGVSGVLLLAESHISIHTWPEQGYAAADIFTCGDRAMPERAARHLARALGSRHSEVTRLARGTRRADQGRAGRAKSAPVVA